MLQVDSKCAEVLNNSFVCTHCWVYARVWGRSLLLRSKSSIPFLRSGRRGPRGISMGLRGGGSLSKMAATTCSRQKWWEIRIGSG